MVPAKTTLAQSSTPPVFPDPVSREAQLEERLRKMDAMNQKLLEQVEALSRKVEAATKQHDSNAVPASGSGEMSPNQAGGDQKAGGAQGTIGRGTNSSTGGESSGSPNSMGVGETNLGIGGTGNGNNVTQGRARGGQGTIGRSREGESPRTIKTTLSNGLRWTSEDDEFQLVFHNLSQAEFRNFPGVGGHSPLKDNFFIPRQRWYFTGRATKNVEFYTVINRGYGSLDLLDAFIDISYDPRIKFRAGRTKTPTSYEYYQIAEGDLIAPERSIYTGNLSGNRQDGFMFLGQVLEKRAEYAVGVFNGPRRSFEDFNNDKDLFAFFNVRPFQKSESLKALNYLNVGGEYDFGNENNVVQPSEFRTANDQSSANSNATLNTLSPAFLSFSNNVVENGPRAHWSAWLAWYYKSFNLLAQYDGGYQSYSTGNEAAHNSIPNQGFFVQAYYFLTGEELTRRVDVKPLRNFAFKDGKLTGPGAVEVHSRISTLYLGNRIFSAGLADPNLWSNQATVVDTGVNWYLNQYTKIYIDYQHSLFGSPVFNGTNAQGKTDLLHSTDLVWLRFQLFF